MKDKLDRLNDIKIENFIWIIYIIIIILSYYANNIETKYILYNNPKDKEEYRKLLLIIFTILTIIYIFFTYESYKDVKELDDNDSMKKKNLTYLSALASTLILISGIIYLIIVLQDENIDLEIAFN